MRYAIKIILGFTVVFLCFVATEARAATNISATTTDHWAWNDVIGWIDFFNTNTVNVSSSALSGYASSSAGDISLDCATTRNGNICGQSQYQVTNDAAGNLSSWGWNDQNGWISFCGGLGTSDCPGSISYRAWISPSGRFQNYAWNDVIGWISLDCTNNPSGCGQSDYKIITSWTPTSTTGTLDSTTYDTGVSAGAQLNSVLWQGNSPAGTAVRFQFAASNSSSGPWSFGGTDGTSNTYYSPSGPNVSLKLDYGLYNDKRYFRYKAFLFSNSSSTLSPRVDDILVNWSP